MLPSFLLILIFIFYMKKLFIAAFFIFSATALFAQQEVTTDATGNKIIRGFISKKELATDTAFRWFGDNVKGYIPEAGAVAAFKGAKDSIHILAFGGTWCSDTKSLLPKFYSLTDAAGFSDDRITLIGVDRNKKTVNHLAEAFAITLVPTFIVLKGGQEIGRVVEYGKTGRFDKELGEIISSKK